MSAPPDKTSKLLHSMQSCKSDIKLWQVQTYLNLMTRQNVSLSPQKELTISKTYPHQSQLAMQIFSQAVSEEFWRYITFISPQVIMCPSLFKHTTLKYMILHLFIDS